MRVLIASAEGALRTAVAGIVTAAGHACERAAEGGRAWRLFTDSTPDVVMLSPRLAHLDTPVLAAQIRASPRGSEAYLVALEDPDAEFPWPRDAVELDAALVDPRNPRQVVASLRQAELVLALRRRMIRLEFRQSAEAAAAASIANEEDAETVLGLLLGLVRDLGRAERAEIRWWEAQLGQEVNRGLGDTPPNLALTIPVVRGGRVLGTLEISRGHGSEAFTTDDAAAIAPVATLAGYALALVQTVPAAERAAADTHALLNALTSVRMEAQLLRREVQQQRGLANERIDEFGRRLDELSRDIAQRIDELTASLLRARDK